MQKLLSFFSLLLVLQPAWCQKIEKDFSKKLDRCLSEWMSSSNVKGVSACIYIPQKGFWEGAQGVSSSGNNIKSSMLFGIASNTKLFTAVALLKLQEKKLLDLDDSLGKWLPPFQHVNPSIRIRELLNHSSGLYECTDIPGYKDTILANPSRIFSPETLISWIDKPYFSRGTDWKYCNTNYLLAALVAEKAAGEKLPKIIRNEILSPLSLENTFFSVYEELKGTIAAPWIKNRCLAEMDRTAINSSTYSAGAMYSTAKDMVNWYKSLFSGKLLTHSSFLELTTFGEKGNYGLGLGRRYLHEKEVYFHGGDIVGYRSIMIYVPSNQVIICVLCNSNPAQVQDLGAALLGKVLEIMRD